MIDYYELLGISSDANEQQITTAYRRLALQYHPDKVRQGKAEDAAVKFAQVNEAYRLLLDRNARAAFDRLLSVKKAAMERQRFVDERRKALKEDLLYREDQFRREQEQREAESALQRELARVQVEEEARRKREQMVRGETEEQCTIKYTVLRPNISGTNIDLKSKFPDALKITTFQSNDGGLIVFDSVASASRALLHSSDSVILEWLVEPTKKTSSNDGNVQQRADYEKMTEQELEEFTINRLRQLAARNK